MRTAMKTTDRRSLLRAGFGGAVALAAALAAQPAMAKELEEGFVIKKDNFDSIKNDTFENKTIASMVPEKLEWMIKNYALTIKLAHSKKIEMDPKYVEANHKALHAGKYRRCPHCAEPIRPEARKCRHCGSEVVPLP